MKRPVVLGITMGDVGGIGPEISVRAATAFPWPRDLRLVLIGSVSIALAEARKQGVAPPSVIRLPTAPSLPRVSVWDHRGNRPLPARPGRATAAASRAAAAWIRAAVVECAAGRLDGMVTAPICKEGFCRAGIGFPGHTEMIAQLTGTERFAMMLIGGGLRVVLATRHIPLSRVPRAVTARAVTDAAELAAEALPWFETRNRTVGVCGLNPHAGEGGTIGREETEVIAPAVARLRRRGVDVAGPIPGDTIFHRARRGEFGAVVAMYHDQGLAPLKMAGFETGVNVTLGLPIVRTSPDHGTAFDIAGRGVADPRSMVAAIRLAYRLARRRNPWRRAAAASG